ncbi:hypothetical protein [Formosa haliotis]|uniref:hypothetical protein n=1 Tax=Formosa haliotis TaxID=1555194 RepID=UPI0008241676|nr:hypothetical protein [Formosa haliotis]
MIKLITYTTCFIWFSLIFKIEAKYHQSGVKPILHTLSIKHKGEELPMQVSLYEVKNKQGIPDYFYMDVESVICLESVCKVIPVRLFWNALGEYQKYELAEDAALEKYKDDFFDADDYLKLNRILANKHSPFKEVYLDEILTVVGELNTDEVDAISGATALELNEEDTVPGAALTCFTLWHWAQGEINSKIKTITATTVSNKELLAFLEDENKDYVELALKEIEQRNIYEHVFVNQAVSQGLAHSDLIPEAIQYLETAPSDIYFSALKQLFDAGGNLQKIAVLKSIQNTIYQPNKDYLDAYSFAVNKLKSFQEFSGFFELMEARNPKSEVVIQNVFPLLNRDFLIARRTYWYLKSKALTPKQQQKIQAFYTENMQRL